MFELESCFILITDQPQSTTNDSSYSSAVTRQLVQRLNSDDDLTDFSIHCYVKLYHLICSDINISFYSHVVHKIEAEIKIKNKIIVLSIYHKLSDSLACSKNKLREVSILNIVLWSRLPGFHHEKVRKQIFLDKKFIGEPRIVVKCKTKCVYLYLYLSEVLVIVHN